MNIIMQIMSKIVLNVISGSISAIIAGIALDFYHKHVR